MRATAVACRALTGQSVAVGIDRGALVWAVGEDGQRRPARVVVGPHYQGEFEVVIICDLEDWDVVESGRRPSDDYWGEACFAWPVEAVDDAN